MSQSRISSTRTRLGWQRSCNHVPLGICPFHHVVGWSEQPLPYRLLPHTSGTGLLVQPLRVFYFCTRRTFGILASTSCNVPPVVLEFKRPTDSKSSTVQKRCRFAHSLCLRFLRVCFTIVHASHSGHFMFAFLTYLGMGRVRARGGFVFRDL